MKLVAPLDPILWTPAAPVTEYAAQVKPHWAAMRNFITRNPNALGIAAPQLGIPYRFFLWRNASIFTVVNPVITSTSAETDIKVEGCFSFPGMTLPKRRHLEIEVSYYDEHMKLQSRRLKGWTARVFQHEIDHLDGVNLFEKSFIEKKIQEAEQRLRTIEATAKELFPDK